MSIGSAALLIVDVVSTIVGIVSTIVFVAKSIVQAASPVEKRASTDRFRSVQSRFRFFSDRKNRFQCRFTSRRWSNLQHLRSVQLRETVVDGTSTVVFETSTVVPEAFASGKIVTRGCEDHLDLASGSGMKQALTA